MLNHYTQFRGNNPFGSQAKMLHHIDRVAEYKATGDTWPVFIEVNLTDKCNLKCEWCISENCRSKDELDYKKLTIFLDDFAVNGGKAVTWSGGGEPTLHPKFHSILAWASCVGLEQGLMTNGCYRSQSLNQFISEDCKWVRFSVDTVDPIKYKRWKGVDCLEQVKRNIKELKDYPVKIGVNCNVHPDLTVDDTQRLLDEFYDTVDYIQFRPILPRYFKDEPVIINQKVWDYLDENHLPKVNLSDDKFVDLATENFFPFSSCEGHFFNPVLQANGDLSVCMYHPKDPRFVFGNIYEESFEHIWLGERRQKVIQELRKLDYKKECQACCKLTELNKFLDFVNHPDPRSDINFL